ncbi:MAG: invasion associated locus B family protein [Alphaproteobacteria bacterium]|jgi:invasion protein IalB|nr:invasion associated locus B family protein [Alphaproteobacteria bacterium]MDP6875064.1 invasion associated locus B family protein [Alphaproteobacteria bacterium]
MEYDQLGLENAAIGPYVVAMKKYLTILAMTTVLCGVAVAAQAKPASPKSLLRNPGIWGAFSLKEGKGLACYMAGQPDHSAPAGVKRGPIWVLITHRPYKKIKGEVGIYVGYPFKPGSTASIDVDGKKFKLYTVDDTAWMENPKSEAKLVRAMRAGKKMVIRGVSKRGTKTTDRYSLKGFTRAHKAINRACKVK